MFYLAMSGDSLDEIVRPEMKQTSEADKKKWLATEKFSERTSGLFKPEFVGTRGVWFTAKCSFFKMRHPMKTNIAAKVFESRMLICIFSAIKISWMFF